MSKSKAVSKLQSKHVVISVQSRKGGVGKTTAAMCLSRVLARSGYAVLMIDADVTGTNAADAVGTPFWGDEDVTRLRTGGKPANLLELFASKCMVGKGMPRDLFKSVGAHGQTGTACPFYMIGSQLEASDGKGLVCSPSILFDELHTFWFREFIEDLCGRFAQSIHTYDPNAPVAIVVDTSPGFVGLAPVIREWLTDLGPEFGKFLTVTSIDAQDIASTAASIQGTHDRLGFKLEVARKYLGISGRGTKAKSIADDEMPFFLRLVESGQPAPDGKKVWPHADLECFTRAKLEPEDADLPSPPVSSYQAVVINRVPSFVRQGDVAFDPAEIVSKDLEAARKILVEAQDIGSYMVPYDEYLELQYAWGTLHRPPVGKVAARRLDTILRRTSSLGHWEIRLFIDVELAQDTRASLEQCRATLSEAHNAVEEMRVLLDRRHFSNVSRLLRPQWLPFYAIACLRERLEGIWLPFERPGGQRVVPEEIDDSVPADAGRFVASLRETLKAALGADADEEHPERNLWHYFLTSMLAVVTYAIPHLIGKGRAWQQLYRRLEFLLVQQVHRYEHSPDRLKKRGPAAFLMDQVNTRKGFATSRVGRMHGVSVEEQEELEDHRELYFDLCRAQARLIDLDRDMGVLVHVLRAAVQAAEGKQSLAALAPNLAAVLDEAIVRKTMSHEDAEAKTETLLSTVTCFREFERVLGNIRKTWGI